MTASIRNLRHGWLRAPWVALLLALWLVPACQKKPNAPAAGSTLFKPASETQPQLLSTIALRGLEGTVGTLGRMAQNLGLPFGEDDLRAMLLARSGVPEGLIESLDLSAPVGVAAVGQKNASALRAAAAQAKSAEAARAFASALGSKVGEQEGAIALRTADGKSYWLHIDGALLVGSETLEGLRAAGPHALAARQAPREDLEFRLFPEALAASDGTDLASSLRQLRADLLDRLRAGGAAGPFPAAALEPLVGAVFDAFLEPALETQRLDLGLEVNEKVGVTLLTRMVPKPGTKLARSLEDGRPYELDPAFKASPLPAGLFAVTYGDEVVDRYRKALRQMAQTKIAGIDVMVAGLEGLVDVLGTSHSGTFGFAGGPEHTLIARLKSGAEPKRALDALEKVLGPAGLGAVVSQSQGPDGGARLAWKREGMGARMDLTVPGSGAPRTEAAILEALSGNHISYTARIAGDRLLMTSSPRGAAHLEPLMSPTKASGVDPELQQVLDETRGREGFIHADLFRLIRPALASASRREPSLAQANAVLSFLPGVEKVRMPVVVSWGGGAKFTTELLVPYRTLENVATLLRPLLGMGMGGALVPGSGSR